MDRLLSASEGNLKWASTIEERLRCMLNRLAGPHPVADLGGDANEQEGHLGTLEMREEMTLITLERIGGILDDLERLV